MSGVLQVKDVLDTDPRHAYETVARATKATNWSKYLMDGYNFKVPENAGRILDISLDEIAELYVTREQLLSQPPKNFHLVNDPLVNHKATKIRDVTTPKFILEHLMEEISIALAVAATRDLPERQIPVVTPVCAGFGTEIDEAKPTIVPILRAGNFMLPGIKKWLTHSKDGSVGMHRDHETLLPLIYSINLPPGREDLPGGEIKKRSCYICDPTLATGVSAVTAIEIARSFGYEHIKFLTLFAVAQGVNAIMIADPTVEIYAAALDEGLTKEAYIALGVGDAGNRMTGVGQ